VPPRNGADDRESEPGTAAVAAASFVEAGESLEHPHAVLKRDARAVVVDHQLDLAGIDGDGSLDRGAGMPRTVVEQMRDG
jgi:hypothetical protein